MALYYLDFRDGDELVVDDEGVELRDMRAVQDEAARALAGFAWDAVRLDGAKPSDGNRGARQARSGDGGQVLV